MKQALITKLNQFFPAYPIEKAWIFGSYARGEETQNSDIDILVRFLPNADISLFEYGGIVYDLELATKKRIDLVQENMLKDFAKKTAEKDKILIYERKG